MTQPCAHSGYGTRGWAGIARPPASWISATVALRVRSGRIRWSTNSARTWPQARDLLTDDHLGAHPAIGRNRPSRQRRVDAVVVGDRDDVEVRLGLDVLGMSRTPAVPSDASVCRCRSARPIGRARRRRCGSPAVPDTRLRDLGCRRGPARSEEDRPPLFRGVGDDPLEGRRHRSRRRHHPFAARTVGRHRDRFEPSPVATATGRRTPTTYIGAPLSIDSSAGPSGRVAGAPKSDTGAPPPVRSRSRPQGRPCAQGAEQLAPSFAQADDPHAVRPARPLEVRLQGRIADGLHRRDGLADPRNQEPRRQRDPRNGGRRRSPACQC